MFEELKQEQAAASLRAALALMASLSFDEQCERQSMQATIVQRKSDFDYHFEVIVNGRQVHGGSL